MYSDMHNPNAPTWPNSVGHPIDRRGHRGSTNPGLWQEGVKIERPFPAGGEIPARDYHRKGHFTDTPETQPMPLTGNGRIRT